MNDSELIRVIGKQIGAIISWHCGDENCKYCHGAGFVKTPWWIKLKAHYIEKLPWKYIKKEIYCTHCKGYEIFEDPDGTITDSRDLDKIDFSSLFAG